MLLPQRATPAPQVTSATTLGLTRPLTAESASTVKLVELLPRLVMTVNGPLDLITLLTILRVLQPIVGSTSRVQALYHQGSQLMAQLETDT